MDSKKYGKKKKFLKKNQKKKKKNQLIELKDNLLNNANITSDIKQRINQYYHEYEQQNLIIENNIKNLTDDNFTIFDACKSMLMLRNKKVVNEHQQVDIEQIKLKYKNQQIANENNFRYQLQALEQINNL